MTKTEKQALKDKYKQKINSSLHTHGNFKVIDSNDNIRALRGLVTTNSVDSENEVVLPDGLDWTYFIKTGGWVYWRHAETIDDANVLPVGVGKDIKRTFEGWEATTNLLKKPDGWVNWLPDAIYSMVSDPASNGKLGASIGFIPSEGRPATEKDKSVFGNSVEWVWTKAKVLEYSLCPDPSNADSMNTIVKSASNSQEYKEYIKESLKLKDLKETEEIAEAVIEESEIEAIESKEVEPIHNDFSKIMEMLNNMQGQLTTVFSKIEELGGGKVEETETEITEELDTVENEAIEETETVEQIESTEPMEEFTYVVNTVDNSFAQKKLGKIEIK